MESFDRYALYGDLAERDTAILATVLLVKGVPVDLVPENASLSLSLAARAGQDRGPYLRTPEGFVLAGRHGVLEWIERIYPAPTLLPTTPVRRTVARLVEDWIDLWLPHWPRRSWSTLERLAVHLDSAGFLLGARPIRADWLLAGWLETEVLCHDHARAHLSRHAPRLVSFGEDLLAESLSEREEGEDVIPISLLSVLEEIGIDYHGYLALNHQALKDQEVRVMIDLGLGKRPLPVQAECERRRIAVGRELAALDRDTRRRVAEMLEPLSAWHCLTLPPAMSGSDPSDPRSL